MPSDTREFDLIILGATSFTAKLTIELLVKKYGSSGDKLKYCLAGRSEKRLDALCASMKLGSPPLRVMGNSYEDLLALAKETKVLINFVGPYGDKNMPSFDVVKACVNAETHYIDISGETDWCQFLTEEYNQAAVKSGTKILPCMGFDFTSFDMGMAIMRHKQGKDWKGSNIVCEVDDLKDGLSGGTLNTLIRLVKQGAIRSDANIKAAAARNMNILPKAVEGGFLTSTLMSGSTAGYLTWMNEYLLHNSWSSQPNQGMEFDIGTKTSGGFSLELLMSTWTTIIFYCQLAIIVLIAMFGPESLVNKVVPTSGNGPSARFGEGFVHNNFKFYTPAKDEPTAELQFRFDGGGAYVFTAVTVLETAMTILEGPTGEDPQMLPKEYIEAGGVGTGSTLLGDAYRKRLDKAACRFNFM